ncbi:MAG: hypothetical protein JWL59_159 [Chthoniobacteraceae bacterium]|nr:hypothetical protein [Chthoniobacteraceae bacterium]
MLVPRTALIVWVASFVLPVAIVGGTLPGALGFAGLLIALFLMLVLLDALLARRGTHGIRLHLPELVRLQKDRPGVIEVRVANPQKVARAVRIGLAWPREMITAEQERRVSLPAGAAMAQIEWAFTPSRRGQYILCRAYLEVSSPLGFWAARKADEVRCELRVYPNLIEDRKNVAALFLKRGVLGVHAQRQAGQGREFEKLREYLHGDSVDDIHWKASAKRGHPVTKIFQVERTQEVYVIVDASRLTARALSMGEFSSQKPPGLVAGERSTTVLERFVSASLILGLAAEQQGDQFGLITFSDKVLGFVRARTGQAHYDACRDRLYRLESQTVTPDFEELFTFIRLKLRKRALLIFLTALDDPILAEAFTKSVSLICRQHLVFVDMLKPPAANPLFSSNVAKLDDIYAHLGGHLQWRQLGELEKVLRQRGVRFSLLDPARLPADLVAQHAEVKARQLI